MNRQPFLVAVGDNCVDYYVQTRTGYPGGNPVNVAVYFTRLGGRAAYIGAVGTDEGGALICDGLRRKNVDISHIHTVQAHAAGILGGVVDQAGNGHGVGHIGEVAQQHVVGHLLFEVAGGQQRQEICAAFAHLAAHLNGLHGGLEDAAGHDGLACALVLHDGLQHAELLGVGQALVFAVGAQGQIALEAGSGIAFHVLGEALVVHAAIGGKGRGDGGENAHQLLFHR